MPLDLRDWWAADEEILSLLVFALEDTLLGEFDGEDIAHQCNRENWCLLSCAIHTKQTLDEVQSTRSSEVLPEVWILVATAVHQDEEEEEDEHVVRVPEDLKLSAFGVAERSRVDEKHGSADETTRDKWPPTETVIGDNR